jgi:hypothetical protein
MSEEDVNVSSFGTIYTVDSENLYVDKPRTIYEHFIRAGPLTADKLKNITFRIDHTTKCFEEEYFGPVKGLVEPIEPSLRTIDTGRVNFATKITYVPVDFEGPNYPLEIVTVGDLFPSR